MHTPPTQPLALRRAGGGAVLVVLVAALTACADDPPPWRGGSGDGGRLRADHAACRAYADDEAMRKSGAVHGADIGGLDSSFSPSAQLAAYDARRIYDRALTACMTAKGYSRSRGPVGTATDAVEDARGALRW